jgi:pullulanase
LEAALMKIFTAILQNFNKIKVTVDNFTEFRSYKFEIENGNTMLYVKKYSVIENDITLTLDGEINIKNECFIQYENIREKVWFFPLFSTEEFDDKYYHDSILGATYNKHYTIFRVWSPVATYIDLLLYYEGNPSGSEKHIRLHMQEHNGLWTLLVKGDLHGMYYTYEVKVFNNLNEVVDPYAKAVGINGIRGAIVDLNKTNPENWQNDASPKLESYTDAIIYETSIRDISSHPNSGVKYSGKFLALTENNTTYYTVTTCLDHIKELGITHIQFMPIFDFCYLSIDEKKPVSYNWGYDPQNYNVPEGSYSTNPYDPVCRIKELKAMIQHLHKNNLCINMDVVYNHVANAPNSNFEKIFPGYYFRFYNSGTPSNGSGCGNDVASEHSMMRKFIIDSVSYWAKEYHIDGFRFDLMGLLDITTMNSIHERLLKLDRNIMLYGEGWDLNTFLDRNLKAAEYNTSKLPNLGFFNERIRDCIKGNVFSLYDKGFATGKPFLEEELKKCISAYYLKPNESINYVSCHDNYTLWDKIDLSCNNESFEIKKKMLKLSAAIILTSQGVPFIYSGEEFCRTKNGNDNSFNKPDDINWMDWDRKLEFLDVFDYYKKVIAIRNNHAAFRINNIDDIKNHLHFIDNTPNNTVAFILKDYANNDVWKEILVAYNANKEPSNITIPDGKWRLALGSDIDLYKDSFGGSLKLDGVCAYIFYR